VLSARGSMTTIIVAGQRIPARQCDRGCFNARIQKQHWEAHLLWHAIRDRLGLKAYWRKAKGRQRGRVRGRKADRYRPNIDQRGGVV
jgi:hypothetical protein